MMREFAFVPFLAACAPARLPVDVAERQCFARAIAAQTSIQTTPTIGIGIGTDGHGGVGLGLDLTPRTIRRVDPGETYNKCVIDKTGMPPRAPLATIRKG